MKIKSILGILLSLCLLIAPAAAAGGDGTSANPYQIETAAELQSIQNDLSAHYILMNDIDLSGVTWTPIGSSSSPFFGELDGNGKKLYNLIMSRTAADSGLFGALTTGATIKDLIIEEFDITSSNSNTACLVGQILMSESETEEVIITNIDLIKCSVNVIQSNANSQGILCGGIKSYSKVNISDCLISTSNIKSQSIFTGLISGVCDTYSELTLIGITISNSYVESTKTYTSLVVGRCANAASIIVNNCICENNIVNGINNVGLMVGSVAIDCNCIVADCTSNNNIIKGITYCGGLVGILEGAGANLNVNNCIITDCTVSASLYAGGIVGRILSTTTGIITDCTVSGCTVLANTDAAGICPSFR